MVAIPGLGWQDVAVVQSLLRGADFICRVHDSPGELGHHIILVRDADLAAIKAFLADYRIRDQFDRLHPIPW